MNETSKATPRPWQVSRSNAGAIPPHFQPLEIIGRGGNASVAAQLGIGPEANANAALIVKAVNSHDALVEACEAALGRMEAVASGILVEKRAKGVSQAAHVRHMAGHLEQHAKIFRAAITKATA